MPNCGTRFDGRPTDGFGLRQIMSTSARAGTFAGLFALLNCGIGNAEDIASNKFIYERAVEYCRGSVTRPIALSDDKSMLCFDGWITPNLDISLVDNLKENGLFVVRSFGGSAETGIALADRLRDKHAIVIVYDYCNSACAAYLFIATDQTVVRKNSIVVWHHIQSGLPDCFQMKTSGDESPKSFERSPCPDVPPEEQTSHWRVKILSDKFHKDRTLAPGFDPPESSYVRRVLKNMIDATGSYPDVAWMWNPRFYKSVLKTKVSYEAYPESQTEVDEIVARFHFRRVIYDP
jgi:hypothetical protein